MADLDRFPSNEMDWNSQRCFSCAVSSHANTSSVLAPSMDAEIFAATAAALIKAMQIFQDFCASASRNSIGGTGRIDTSYTRDAKF